MKDFAKPGFAPGKGIVIGGEANGLTVLAGTLLAAALAKSLVLFLVGPSIQPDSAEYLSFADAILAQGSAFQPFDFGAAALPHPVFRMIGYPLIIAAAKLLSPPHWAALVVILQGTATLVASGVIFLVLQRLFASTGAAAFVVILYLGSGSLLWDNSILSDSLYASFFNIVIFALIGDLIGRWRMSFLGVLGLALLWGYSLILRDSGTYFTVLPLILLSARAWRRRGDGWLCLAPVVLFLAVTVGTIVAYMAFNWYRTGAWFFGITGVANWLRPVFDMARYGYAKPFDGDDLVSSIMRTLPADYDFPAQMRFLDALHAQCRCTPLVLQTIVFNKFVATVAQHPFAYLAVIWRNINYLGLGSLLADPVATLNQFIQLGIPGGQRVVPVLSMRNLAALAQDFSLVTLGLTILSVLSTTVSAVLFTGFLFGVPYLAYRTWQRRRLDTRLAVAGFLWLAFVGVALAFALIHFEARHALPILPAGMAGIAYVLCCYRQWRETRIGPGALPPLTSAL